VIDGGGLLLGLGGLLGLTLDAAAGGQHAGEAGQRQAGAAGAAEEAATRQALGLEELLERTLDSRITHVGCSLPTTKV
jgi:hypothetical protein